MARIKGMRGTVIALIAAAVALAGCSFGRPSSASSPRAQMQDAPSTDAMSLRKENDALKQEQLENARQIEALQRALAAQAADQKRFREMMSTNFDLLEQSVALTLSKSIDNGIPAKAPATAQASTAPSKPAAKTVVAAPVPAMGPSAMKPTIDEVSAPQEAPESAAPAPMEAAAPKTIGQTTTRPASMGVSPAGLTGAMGASAAKPMSATTASGAAKPHVAAAAPKTVIPVVAMTQAAPAPMNDPDLTPPKNPKVLTANRAAKALYERGFALYANRQYDQAILVYQNFLSRYPEDVYSDNAQFWIGESYLHMDKVADAEAAYRKVLREYDHKNSLDGYKTPEAIYRLGTLAQKRNDQRAARYYFGNVAQRFPESSAGRKAARELEGKPTTAQSDMQEEKSGG